MGRTARCEAAQAVTGTAACRARRFFVAHPRRPRFLRSAVPKVRASAGQATAPPLHKRRAPALDVSAKEAGVTNDDRTLARFQAYWEAIRLHVCGVCLDQADDGECGLTRRACALQMHLPRLAEVLSRVHSTQMDDYEAAVRAEICPGCSGQDAQGRCALREK